MTEMEFWLFLKNALSRGRLSQMTYVRDSGDITIQEAGKYFGGHSILPRNHDKIGIDTIIGMGNLLLTQETSPHAKEAILMILAHHPSQEALSALKEYNKNPDEELKYTAHFALEECEYWNE